jgi:hypothetical protein
MNRKAEELEKFLNKYPEFKRHVVGYKSDRGLGVSRIDNDWYECDYYLVTVDDIQGSLNEMNYKR